MVANEQNLMPIEEVNARKTREQQIEDCKKAGIASGKARREKATMRQVLLDMLSEIPKENNPKGLSYQQMATLGLIKGAVKGNAQNYKTMVETLGEISGTEDKSNGVINDLIEALNNAKHK